jgi:SAM-dependent methyltransferase
VQRLTDHDRCCGLADQFDERHAQEKLADYRLHGPPRSTRVLLDALRREGVTGETVLDVGAGVGAVYLDLLGAGAASAVDVDGSEAYLAVSRREAERHGLVDRVEFRHGDLVELAHDLDVAGVVTLDRVICCYADVRALVVRSAWLATKLYGVVYPRDAWWSRLGVRLVNGVLRLRRSSFRVYIHATADIVDAVRVAGLVPRMETTAGVWRVALFVRPPDATAP